MVHLFENFTFRSHICMSFELLSYNLYEVIKRNKFQGFNLHLVRKFALNIIICLESLNRNKIIHCDLKPENVLLKTKDKSGIKVIDFGSSCYENQRIYTYIQSRFYRAPEVILGGKYGMPIDMWSLGCILAELHTGTPLLPGEDEGDQLATMIELLGMPPKSLLDQCKRSRTFINSKGFPRYCTMVQNNDVKGADGKPQITLLPGRSRRGKIRGTPGTKSWKQSLKNCDDQNFLNFLKRCLTWDPNERMVPKEALNHPWIRNKPVKYQTQNLQKISSQSSNNQQSSTSSSNTSYQVSNSIKLNHNNMPTNQKYINSNQINQIVNNQVNNIKQQQLQQLQIQQQQLHQKQIYHQQLLTQQNLIQAQQNESNIVNITNLTRTSQAHINDNYNSLHTLAGTTTSSVSANQNNNNNINLNHHHTVNRSINDNHSTLSNINHVNSNTLLNQINNSLPKINGKSNNNSNNNNSSYNA